MEHAQHNRLGLEVDVHEGEQPHSEAVLAQQLDQHALDGRPVPHAPGATGSRLSPVCAPMDGHDDEEEAGPEHVCA